MITRSDVLEKASIDCLKELYSKVQPSVDWDDFMQQNKDYSIKYKQWEQMENRPPIEEFCGPRPFEFYYLPRQVMKEITDSYVQAYRMGSQQELLDTIEILKKYCQEPIVDKYVDDYTDKHGNHHPGYRSYNIPDNLQTELQKIIVKENPESNEQELASDCISKFFEFLDMAGNFYNWNRDLNAFNTTVYLGPSPCSNKETVIDNWKKYRNKDITIDDSVYENEEE